MESQMPRAARDLTEETFGTRKVLERAKPKRYKGSNSKRSYKAVYWKVQCQVCKTISEVQGSALKHGDGCRICYENSRRKKAPYTGKDPDKGDTKRPQRARKRASPLRNWKASRGANKSIPDDRPPPLIAQRPPPPPHLSNSLPSQPTAKALTAGEIATALSGASWEDKVRVSTDLSDKVSGADLQDRRQPQDVVRVSFTKGQIWLYTAPSEEEVP
jgi:hypothetical protein